MVQLLAGEGFRGGVRSDDERESFLLPCCLAWPMDIPSWVFERSASAPLLALSPQQRAGIDGVRLRTRLFDFVLLVFSSCLVQTLELYFNEAFFAMVV